MPTRSCLLALFLSLVCASSAVAQQSHVNQITGQVVDGRTGRPLAGALVHVDSQPLVAETDDDGRFSLALPSGTYTLYVSLVGYALTRQVVTLAMGDAPPVRIELAEGAGSYTEHVMVSGAAESDRAAGGVLRSRELLNLRGVMLDDPLRAVQALPSATATDDFYSEFAVRGSTFRHVGLIVDGVPTRYLMHTVHGVTDGGSIAMINGETVGAVSLSPGSYAQRTGRRLGARVDLALREGTRERVRGRAGLSGTSATLLVEGPLGARGSYLGSIRRSYLDLLIERIEPDSNFAFGFTDAQGKLVFDLTPRHQLQLTNVLGRARFDEKADDLGPNDEATAGSYAWLSSLAWRYTPSPRFTVTQRLFVTGLRFDNRNPGGVVLDSARAFETGWRADASYALRDGWLLEFGGDAERLSDRRDMRRRLNNTPAPVLLNAYDKAARAGSAYVQAHRAIGSWLTLSPGARVDHWGATRERTASPWLRAEAQIAKATRVLAGTGVYRQYPDLEQIWGIRGGGEGLAPERALHVDVGIVQTLPHELQLQVTGYTRREDDVLWTPGGEPRRLSNGQIQLGFGDAPWRNDLNGRASGIELVMRRDSPGGLSGWAGYAWARHRYTSATTGDRFWGDADQRHTLSLYGHYQLSHRTTFSAKFRYGSNYPIVGYIGEPAANASAPALFPGAAPLFLSLADRRNQLRLPAYARLDIRADRAFVTGRRRITVFAEVANVLNRTNWRNVPYDIDRSGRVFGVRDSLMPIVPSAGFVVEF